MNNLLKAYSQARSTRTSFSGLRGLLRRPEGERECWRQAGNRLKLERTVTCGRARRNAPHPATGAAPRPAGTTAILCVSARRRAAEADGAHVLGDGMRSTARVGKAISRSSTILRCPRLATVLDDRLDNHVDCVLEPYELVSTTHSSPPRLAPRTVAILPRRCAICRASRAGDPRDRSGDPVCGRPGARRGVRTGRQEAGTSG